jgi:Zn-dependent M16 (insulinase) family peptidase
MATTETPIVDSIRAQVEKEISAQYEAKFTKEIADYQKKLSDQNEEAIQKAIAEFREEQKPPSQESISQLLSQEYLTFKVKLPVEDEEGKPVEKEFTIGELPQRAEKIFYRKFKEQIIPRAADVGALTFEILEGDVAKKITSALESFEPTFDLMADACVLILNPKNKYGYLNKEWVQDNVSSYRQWNIIQAQVQVNRLRDFFSQLSRGSSKVTMNLGASIPNLRP